MKIDIQEIKFDPASVADPNGRVFHWNGGIYRGISRKAAKLYWELLHRKEVSYLFEAGLVETEITPLELPEYEFVVKHYRIPHLSYGFEWCGAMFKDAALLLIDLSIELAKLDLELQDAHPWNIMFDSYKPVYIDFGSIVPIQGRKRWRPENKFISRFLNPLYLMSKGNAIEPRTLRPDPNRGYKVLDVQDKDLPTLLTWKQRIHWRLVLAQRRMKFRRSYDRMEKLTRLKNIVERIEFKVPKTERAHVSSSLSFDDPVLWNQNQRKINEIIDYYRPKTLLDIECNTGWYSKVAAKKGLTVVAFDKDEYCVQSLYHEASKHNYNILPLLMNYLNPTPAYGIRKQYPPATQRLKCEMIVSSATIFKNGLRFQEIARALAAFSEKLLLLEAIPPGDCNISKGYSNSFILGHCTEFIDILKKHFTSVETIPVHHSPTILLLCKR